MSTYSLVLPFHSDLTSIGATTERARNEGAAHGVMEVLLAHNGRPLGDEARREVEALVVPAAAGKPEVRLLDTTDKGIGAGYKLGIKNARAEFVILSADDLPFGWSDVDAFERAGRPDFAIGSKAHPDSRRPGESRAFSRRVSTYGFLTLRRLLLGWNTPGDSQGSLILRTSTAQSLLPDLVYDHYLSSLELATLHLKRGGKVVEVPTIVDDAPHPSSVSVLRDGWKMATELVDLRRRVKRL
jgi:hypothetical protein